MLNKYYENQIMEIVITLFYNRIRLLLKKKEN